ncbi:FtsX-like permease family protein [Dyadobacter arcticus]|uniref:ABC transport system permease protein n=1 Tax=Dyadobacter arcticus TaxID=1078754 RepID=A0ABX0UV62_9BACT|nr:FtsX-like permease family protein [Dyadobacter arcticus]NIJ55779.1 putative ABC transport system permease protein [Dyadobacter arcticus]
MTPDKSSKPNALPPRWLDKLASKICAPHLREELIGDLQERYTLRLNRYGRQKAILFYVKEVIALLQFSILKRKPSPYPSLPLFSFEMIRNYIKIGSRVLLKNKGYTFIHLIGLSIGLWACMMVATVVIDSLSYDKQWSRSKDIYRIVSADKKGEGIVERMSSSHEGLAQELQKLYPEVQAWSMFSNPSRYFKLKGTDPEGIKTQLLRMDTTAWGMLDIKVLSGNPRHFVDGTNNIVLTKSYAAKFFPGQDLTGKIIYDIPSYQSKGNPYLITGIVDDLPYNSHLRADVIWVEQNKPEAYAAVGFYSYSQNYVMLKPGTDIASFTSRVNKWYSAVNKDKGAKQIEFQPMESIYLHSDFSDGQRVKGDARIIQIFSGTALLLLFIACVNFVNLSTARAFARLKEAGMRRILSGSRYQLIIQFLTETLILFALSVAAAATLYYLSLHSVEDFLGHRLVQTFTTNLSLAGYAVLTIFVTGLVTGLYPAWLISGFKPANTLRGIITTAVGQNTLRKSLVVLQFSISIVILLATIVVWKQLSLMENKNLGYDKNNLLSIGSVSWDGKADAFKTELLRIPGVVRASTSQWLPTQGGGYMTKEVPDPINAERRIQVWFIAGDVDLPATLGLKLVSGRMFSSSFSTDALNADSLQQADFAKYEQSSLMQASLMTATAAKLLGVKQLNEQIASTKTVPIGTIADFNNESLYEPVKPTLILAHRSPQYGGMLIRVQPGTERQVTASVQRLWKQFYPSKLLDINEVNDLLFKQYESEIKLQQLFIFFSGLTMFLSALGIFGLVVQAAEQRSKEVGIRKVLGASVAGIVALLSKDFLKLVMIAIVVASPLAWLSLTKWLEHYPFRTDINWWIFVVTGIGALAMTLLTISFQALRAALADPVKSLRNE